MSGKSRKFGRNTRDCTVYRTMMRREINKAGNILREMRVRAKRRMREWSREGPMAVSATDRSIIRDHHENECRHLYVALKRLPAGSVRDAFRERNLPGDWRNPDTWFLHIIPK